jgi:hypothetical protein
MGFAPWQIIAGVGSLLVGGYAYNKYQGTAATTPAATTGAGAPPPAAPGGAQPPGFYNPNAQGFFAGGQQWEGSVGGGGGFYDYNTGQGGSAQTFPVDPYGTTMAIQMHPGTTGQLALAQGTQTDSEQLVIVSGNAQADPSNPLGFTYGGGGADISVSYMFSDGGPLGLSTMDVTITDA